MNGYFKSESGKVRAEPGSTRWVYNKFLRLQTKLRWVCGLCNVWCKDENGFKCHLEHENHIRKSEIARQSAAPEFKMSARDEAFAASFVQYLAQNYLNRTVLLHEIYREMYPDDKFQRLMHDTCWGSLGTFINALSKAGECEAYKGPKGWTVRIDQDMLLAAEAEREAREAREATEARLGAKTKSKEKKRVDTEDEEDDLEAGPAGGAAETEAAEEPTDMTNRVKVAFQLCAGPKKRPTSAETKDSERRKIVVEGAVWPKGLVVKVLCPDALEGQALGQKAVTLDSEDLGVHLRLLKLGENGQELQVFVKNELLETVLPKLGSRVLVLDGSGPMEGTLQSVETQSYSCTVQTEKGRIAGLPYDRVCKIWAPS
ncbi:DNA/RNA-binding protein KIN17 (Binding to curved DNA) (KIN [Durusdinium trenchii]|uniref:Antigenic determinant of recA protein n=1 Tax=Durusdinium trenchii TaxID=1381693 RepID=A0ABP0RH33_9DINO